MESQSQGADSDRSLTMPNPQENSKDWERKFMKFQHHPDCFYEKTGVCECGMALKLEFIRQNFVPKSELIEMLEKMKKGEDSYWGTTPKKHEGYNKALSEILERIKKL